MQDPFRGTKLRRFEMNILTWILQSLLAAMFLMAGLFKLSKSEDYSRKYGVSPVGLVKFIGTSELLGAIGLIVPAATHILPWLTPTAAVGLAIIMALATGFHVRKKEYGPSGFTTVLFLISVFVAWSRFAA